VRSAMRPKTSSSTSSRAGTLQIGAKHWRLSCERLTVFAARVRLEWKPHYGI
jgi:hypothetical protein